MLNLLKSHFFCFPATRNSIYSIHGFIHCEADMFTGWAGSIHLQIQTMLSGDIIWLLDCWTETALWSRGSLARCRYSYKDSRFNIFHIAHSNSGFWSYRTECACIWTVLKIPIPKKTTPNKSYVTLYSHKVFIRCCEWIIYGRHKNIWWIIRLVSNLLWHFTIKEKPETRTCIIYDIIWLKYESL